MEISHINPDGIYKHPAFTSIVTVSDPQKLHFFAGRTPADESYRCVAPGDMLAQYRQVMNILTRELEEVGATWSDVVYRRIFTTDVDACLAAAASPEIASFFDPDRMPPSTLVGVTRLSDPEFMVEIDLLAVTE
ncbi:MAG TPA: RidA family protein [Actinomycetes bacterium]|nr:RidA family protein [Actinomycetes bacterium]